MKLTFKDFFSEDSVEYNRCRPKYPAELFSWLSSLSNQHSQAWDCATGTGQAATALTDYFSEVIATDASKSQIDNAEKKSGITYRVATAENSHIEDNSVDLITVAQAIHWFDIDTFSTEVDRVLKDKGIIAAWTYNLLSVNEAIDEIISFLYQETLANYWPEERKMVEEGYKNIQLSLTEIKAPEFIMTAEWNLSQLIGYLCTWSATQEYQKALGLNPVKAIYEEIAGIWGSPEKALSVRWPLSVRLWQKDT